MKLIIFIGGVPGTGKTTLAHQLAINFHIDKVLSLDIMKETLKSFVGCENDPYLYSTTHEAYQIEGLNPVDGFNKHCECIQSYLLPLLMRMQNDSIVLVEGAQLTPDILQKIDTSIFVPIYINLYCEKKETLLERYEKKCRIRKYRWADNIDIICAIQEYLLTSKRVFHLSSNEKVYETAISIITKIMEENHEVLDL